MQQHGAICDEPAHITDISATCLDVAGIDYPDRFRDRQVLPPAGQSLQPLFSGSSFERQGPLCWNTSGSGAIRSGNWELVSTREGPWELYDLSVDRTELNNLAEQYPERVAEMARACEAWRQDGAD